MFEAKITIETPGLSQALNRLADAMAYPTTQVVPQTQPVTTPATAPVAAPVPPTAAPVSSAPPAAAPLSPPPGFTLEQIRRAGADLVSTNPGKYPELMTLMGQFGISVIDQLRPEQYGPFANALRGLGAKL